MYILFILYYYIFKILNFIFKQNLKFITLYKFNNNIYNIFFKFTTIKIKSIKQFYTIYNCYKNLSKNITVLNLLSNIDMKQNNKKFNLQHIIIVYMYLLKTNLIEFNINYFETIIYRYFQLNLEFKNYIEFNKFQFNNHLNFKKNYVSNNIIQKFYSTFKYKIFLNILKFKTKLNFKKVCIIPNFNYININFFFKNYLKNLYNICFSSSHILKYIKYKINNNIILFLRKNKIFNKGRYSRNRQIYRTGVY